MGEGCNGGGGGCYPSPNGEGAGIGMDKILFSMPNSPSTFFD